MQTISDLTQLRQQIKTWKQQGDTVAFVPTMGNLHQGHISLVEEAKKHANRVVVSIFVNPMQFGEGEDLDKYPRTLPADSEKLIAVDTDLLFTPTAQTIYPKGLNAQTYIEVPGVSDNYCGASRPGHFRGVATIVNKLFNLVQPDVACFGEKDFQQLQVIRTMVEDLAMPIEIIGVPTARETNGLAKSSRNGYLSSAQKQQAGIIYQSLLQAADKLQQQKPLEEVKAFIAEQISQQGLTIDYIEIAERSRMQDAVAGDKKLVILVAALLGQTRLIDNWQVDLN
ncbi:pantothenate synthetase [Catenovulum agarivorans DS-2]|uniref:Pantothenate synthetase n=1 Tax=Catenovulum agarivorans DS-2 TaxID=1328313 RepID=W7QMW9_9ALTE|nr:pantoate--beta-alanine ligase [Catenovulum agarivorans]EWH10292.1 pantothenate synthetase [Catenovulum agarivorans DS-2]